MVLRQMGDSEWIFVFFSSNYLCCYEDPTEKEEKTKESLEKAKEAVAMDVKDGMSWSRLNIFFSQ